MTRERGQRIAIATLSLLAVCGLAWRAIATEELGSGAYSEKKIKFGQSSAAMRDTLTLPGRIADNFLAPTASQLQAFAGSNVTLKVGSYCRTFGPLVDKSGLRKRLQVKTSDFSTGEIFKATFAEGSTPGRLGTAISIRKTSHSFPTGTFPRPHRSGDPTSIPVTLIVGSVGGTFDTITGARLPFSDPGQQTATEELPDRQALELEDVWTFPGKAGQKVSFRVDTVGASPSGLDLAAELVAPDGSVLKKADDEADCTVPTACGFRCPEVTGFVLPSDGTYSIVVHDFGAASDGCDSGGTYSLSISEPACTSATLALDSDDTGSASRAFLSAPGDLLE